MEDQLSLGSCTANAVVGMVEYFQKRAYGRHIEGSRLFVYKATRKLMLSTGDSGAWLRSAMGALVLFGVPDEKYFPYTFDGENVNPDWDIEPDAFLYSLANHYSAINYFCHDPLGKKTSKKDVLRNVKTYLAAGIPSAFGFLDSHLLKIPMPPVRFLILVKMNRRNGDMPLWQWAMMTIKLLLIQAVMRKQKEPS